MDRHRLFQQALAGSNNISFHDMVALVQAFGFHLSRVRGSHHLFAHPGIQELINLQEVKGKVKPYQVRQFVKLVERYNLTIGDQP